MKKIEVVAAVLIHNSKIFCAQRKNEGLLAKKWEFPGGKIEIGETKEEALIRELKEELDFDATIDRYLITVEHEYPAFHITKHSFICFTNGEDIASNEHLETKWLRINEMNDLDWAEADLPIINKLKEIL